MEKNILEIVSNLNMSLYDNEGFMNPDWVDFNIIYRSNGYSEIIEYLGQIIWSQENDERTFDEEKNQYEDLEQFLVKRINTINKIIGSQKFKD